VGLIIAVKESPTRIDYEVDDMTGPPLEVKQFVDNDVSIMDIGIKGIEIFVLYFGNICSS
jgi:hypothetical protein